MTMEKYNDVIVEESAEDIQAADWWFKTHQEQMKSEEVQEYCRFMHNPDNEYNCEQCPANQGFSEWPGHRLPCGQFSCWVTL